MGNEAGSANSEEIVVEIEVAAGRVQTRLDARYALVLAFMALGLCRPQARSRVCQIDKCQEVSYYCTELHDETCPGCTTCMLVLDGPCW